MASDRDGDASLDCAPRLWSSEPVADDLEREQSGRKGSDRKSSEGWEGNLTELAVPRPIDRKDSRRDSLEQEEERAGQRHVCTSDEDDVQLTELAAPPPVERRSQSDEDSAAQQSGHDQSAESKENDNRDEILSPARPSKFATELYTVSWLTFFSFLGTLARLGLEAITSYPNAPWSSPVLWANLGGSLFLGFLLEDRNLFREEWGRPEQQSYSFHPSKTQHDTESTRARVGAAHGKVKKTLPLFIGLSTGFCGSFTSFSSFVRDAFLALSNALPLPSASPYDTSSTIPSRNGGFSFEALAAIIIIHPIISLAALRFGAHLALLVSNFLPIIPFQFTRRVLDPLAVPLAFGCWLGAVLLSVFPPEMYWRRRATFSLVFAPPGCLLRFYASKHLNAYAPSFPLGTFFVNIFGTCILGMCYDLQHARRIGAAPGGSRIACAVLDGVMEGFCGCATTVSTWVAEVNGLRRRHGYMYGIASVSVALGLMVAIMGSVAWTSGFGVPLCG